MSALAIIRSGARLAAWNAGAAFVIQHRGQKPSSTEITKHDLNTCLMMGWHVLIAYDTNSDKPIFSVDTATGEVTAL